MISDTLSDAIAEMRSYMAEYPQYYEDVKAQIEGTIQVMEVLRVRLDTPPHETPEVLQKYAEGWK